ncbi:hypothetical protein Hdeb2414_s0016g00483841 [Helianthus debilis subsp. tardiflorus]
MPLGPSLSRKNGIEELEATVKVANLVGVELGNHSRLVEKAIGIEGINVD